jgi:hypothetical protein
MQAALRAVAGDLRAEAEMKDSVNIRTTEPNYRKIAFESPRCNKTATNKDRQIS